MSGFHSVCGTSRKGGIPPEVLVAQVVAAKHADHLPLYRQAQIYARQRRTVRDERSRVTVDDLHQYLEARNSPDFNPIEKASEPSTACGTRSAGSSISSSPPNAPNTSAHAVMIRNEWKPL